MVPTMNRFMPQSSIWMQYLVSALTTTAAAIKHTLVPLIFVCHDSYCRMLHEWLIDSIKVLIGGAKGDWGTCPPNFPPRTIF